MTRTFYLITGKPNGFHPSDAGTGLRPCCYGIINHNSKLRKLLYTISKNTSYSLEIRKFALEVKNLYLTSSNRQTFRLDEKLRYHKSQQQTS